MVRRVAVVGAGNAGLVCIKTCVEEGLEPVCFESSDDIGGLWKFKETPEPQRSSIYRSLVTNTSKEMTCFSDFPMPADYPNYMKSSYLLQYFRLYANNFDLLRYINFQTTVTCITQRPDFHLSGQWDIVTTKRNGEEERHIFDAVLVCSGQYTQPVIPLSDFSGYETFSGRYFHSWEYKDADACRGKRVVVVGIGSSGGDIATEISRTAEKTFLSTRQGAWVISRMSSKGLPMDMMFITRLCNLLIRHLPKTLANWMAERALNSKYDHKLYGLKPTHRFFEKKTLISDDLPARILQGALIMKTNMTGFKGSSVFFDDGTVEENIDIVVFCTGYNGHFPFLPSTLPKEPHGGLRLYKRLFPPSLQHNTLALMGLFQAQGPIMPVVEMQARWAVRVFLGLCHLPSKEEMLAVIESEKKRNMKCYLSAPREASLRIDYIPYVDFMAKEVGVRPNILTLLLKDPVLWAKVYFGPCTPYQYRLTGPGKWGGARHAILTQWERNRKNPLVRCPFKEQGESVRLARRSRDSFQAHKRTCFLCSMVQKVAVIGAGPSGLSSIKVCLDEGLEPTCFESSHDLGGIWRFKEKPEPGRANIYESVVLNSSKEMIAFSDFPPPAEFPNHMHHTEVLQYLRLYSEAFNLLQHIHFETNVVSVRQRSNFEATGQWEVETERSDGQREIHFFDAVIVCTGHYTQPHLPLKDFPGIESFGGRYIHSWDYRNAEGLQGKRVVVIGMGNSGGDIAVDVSRVAERVYLSTRTGAWVVGRVGPGGLPNDVVRSSRMDMMLLNLFPSWINRTLEKMLNKAFDHTLYGLRPNHGFFTQIPVVNDDLPARILSGRVQVKPNVKEFCGSSVVFVDGSRIDKVDVVVFATGYNYSFPFLPVALQVKCGYRLRLYKHVFPPAVAHPTLAFVGFIHALGAINPLAEIQARWATRVFKGLITLPSEETMKKDIEKDTKTMHKRFACTDRSPLQVDYIFYQDTVAKQVGVRPNILWLFLTDPRLALQVFFGPCTAYQYRLTGPGQWAGARQAILTQMERVVEPFRTRVVPEPETRVSSRIGIMLIVSSAALLGCFCWNKQHMSPFLPTVPFFRSPK
ncbi:hypothetical protein Q5P01_016288 [Channa striata]|uniref:Flavin-containing monooxygenase n=1 Tax=Channa striata TaxID=64152 RepID=A0AA88MF02_CHASR|nr:hypothetical protein Q5P01_016288 [Channa striata]